MNEAAYGLDQFETALAGVPEKENTKGTAQKKGAVQKRAMLPRTRRERSELTCREWLNQEALRQPEKWALSIPGFKKHSEGNYRAKPDALGRNCEEDFTITTMGIRDFGQEWDEAVGYTPIELVKNIADGINEDGNLVLAEFDDNAKPQGSLRDDEACRWVAGKLGIDWDAECQKDVDEAFSDPPCDVAALSSLNTKEQIREYLPDLRILKANDPDAYKGFRDWWDMISVLDASELDAWLAEPAVGSLKRLKYLLLADVATLREPHDFVEGFLCDNQLSVIFGDANVGKSFFALDLALHVARGRRWLGREVDRGAVVYLAGEGSGGIRRRIDAHCRHHGIEDRNQIPLAIIPDPVDFRDKRSVEALIQTVKEISAKFGIPTRLIIVDTLSRALAGGNENAPDDMGALVCGAERVRSATGAHLSFIHHTGKDDTKGARGHSLLRAALDTEAEVRRIEGQKGSIGVTVTKQRDLEIGGGFTFRLLPVELGTNARGKPVSSCVVEPVTLKPVLTEAEQEAVDILRTLLFEGDNMAHVEVAAWRKAVMETDGLLTGQTGDTKKKQWQRLRAALETKGVIELSGSRVGLKHG